MSPYALLAALLVLAGTHWAAFDLGADGEVASQARESKVAQVATAAAADAAASAIAGLKIQHRTVQQEVRREIVEKPVYRDCLHSPEQLQRLNDALAGGRPEPAGRGLVPRADAAGGPQLWGDDREAGGGGRTVP